MTFIKGYDPNTAHLMTRDELYALAKDLELPGRSKMGKAELVAALNEMRREARKVNVADRIGTGPDMPVTILPTVESAHAPVWKFPRVSARSPEAIAYTARKRNRVTTERKILRMIRSSGSKHYGVNGRGMGAKHYASLSNPEPVAWVRPAIVGRGLTGAYGR